MNYINLNIEYFKIFYKRTHMGQQISFKPYFYDILGIFWVIYEIKYINIGSYNSAIYRDFFSEDWIFLFAEIFNLLLLILIFIIIILN